MDKVQTYSFVGIGALLHFLVDGLCICCLYLMVCPFDATQFINYFILYNVLAFLTQPLTGYVVDRLKHKHWALLTAVLLLTLAVSSFLLSFFLLSSFLLGMGNSLFHVWGGQQVAVRTCNDIRSLGVFVSTGAFGLSVGAVFFSWWLLFAFLLAIVLLTYFAIFSPLSSRCGTTLYPQRGNHRGLSLLIILVMVVVTLRAWLSEDFTSDIVKTQGVVLLLGFTSMLGKTFGGFLCKWIGVVWAMVLVVAGVLFAPFLLPSSILPSLICLFLVNCTMPVTLWLANLLLPRREGLAFGLLAAALMPAYLLHFIDTSLLLPPLTLHHSLHIFLLPLLATIIIELGVLWFLRERRSHVLWASVVINVLTNVPLNLLVYAGWIDSLLLLLIAELVIVVIETLWYFCFARQWRQAFVYGLLCNAISFLLGLLVQLLYEYIIY